MTTVLSIKRLAKQNENFRKVVLTGKQSQVVLMNLEPGDEIGDEIHPATDQMFFVEEGHCELRINGRVTPLAETEVGFVPAGANHKLVNVGKKPLKLFTVYAPPVHEPTLVEKFSPKHLTKT